MPPVIFRLTIPGDVEGEEGVGSLLQFFFVHLWFYMWQFVLFLPYLSLFWCPGEAVLHDFSFSWVSSCLHLYCYTPTIGMMPMGLIVFRLCVYVYVIPSVLLYICYPFRLRLRFL